MKQSLILHSSFDFIFNIQLLKRLCWWIFIRMHYVSSNLNSTRLFNFQICIFMSTYIVLLWHMFTKIRCTWVQRERSWEMKTYLFVTQHCLVITACLQDLYSRNKWSWIIKLKSGRLGWIVICENVIYNVSSDFCHAYSLSAHTV